MNKKVLCTAVGGALAVSAGAAQAFMNLPYSESLVPYVVKDANRTTVVTVIMSNNATRSGPLHLQYQTKSTTDANTAACQPSSVQVPVTPNDIVTFDTAGILGYPLFGDTTNPAPLGASISYAAPRHGYLVVQSPFATNHDSGLALLNTYWLEVDLANGGAHGDQAVLSGRIGGEFHLYTSSAMKLMGPYQVLNNSASQVAFFPSSVASTVFTVTPLGTAMVTRENNQVALQVLNHNTTPVQGAYDRNENGVDGTVPVTVRCVGRVTPAQLMPGVVANVGWAAQGGWGNLVNLGANGSTSVSSFDNDVIIYQVDTGAAGGKFLDNATRITTMQGWDT